MRAPRRRDPTGTQQRILAAALTEFARRGFAGARVDGIARRARVNKRMLYYYFGNKEDLYREIFRRKIIAKTRAMGQNPTDLAGLMTESYDQETKDLNWTRLLSWEALSAGPQGVITDAERRQPFIAFKEWLKAAQASGRVAKLDPEHFMLALIALDLFPLAFPQLARALTGRLPTDPEFKARHRAFLRRLAPLFQPAPRSPGLKRPLRARTTLD